MIFQPFRFLQITAQLLCVIALSSCANFGPNKKPSRPPVDRAATAWQQLANGHLSEVEETAVLDDYRQAVTDAVVDLANQKTPREWKLRENFAGQEKPWTVRIESVNALSFAQWKPAMFDDVRWLEPRKDTPIKTAVRRGIGAPLAGVRKIHGRSTESEHNLQRDQFTAMTAVIEFPSKSEPVLKLYDPREVQQVSVGKQKLRLAADFASPAHQMLDGRSFIKMAIGGLLRPERFMEKQGLFMLEPYRADKVPVIFVHGLMSDPHIWENEVAALESDPELGKRVQCWYFIYPTGLAVAASSKRLRDAIDLVEKEKDPQHQALGLRRMMLVGHSMGGLLSRMQIIDSENAFWRSWFTKDPDQVPLDPDVKKSLKDSLFFPRNPDIQRAVFIATPHQGSHIADSWIGRFGSWLIRVPLDTLSLVRTVVTLDTELINPERLNFRNLGADSIDTLSPKHPLIKALNSRPLLVPHHSIIGNYGNKSPLGIASDKVVPYWSSHIEGDTEKQELVVPYWHGCVEKPEVVEEVRRIAHLHVLGH